MPKCPIGTEEPFSQAHTASADERSKAIIITKGSGGGDKGIKRRTEANFY
jgi:hypothetical protein